MRKFRGNKAQNHESVRNLLIKEVDETINFKNSFIPRKGNSEESQYSFQYFLDCFPSGRNKREQIYD